MQNTLIVDLYIFTNQSKTNKTYCQKKNLRKTYLTRILIYYRPSESIPEVILVYNKLFYTKTGSLYI